MNQVLTPHNRNTGTDPVKKDIRERILTGTTMNLERHRATEVITNARYDQLHRLSAHDLPQRHIRQPDLTGRISEGGIQPFQRVDESTGRCRLLV